MKEAIATQSHQEPRLYHWYLSSSILTHRNPTIESVAMFLLEMVGLQSDHIRPKTANRVLHMYVHSCLPRP